MNTEQPADGRRFLTPPPSTNHVRLRVAPPEHATSSPYFSGSDKAARGHSPNLPSPLAGLAVTRDLRAALTSTAPLSDVHASDPAPDTRRQTAVGAVCYRMTPAHQCPSPSTNVPSTTKAPAVAESWALPVWRSGSDIIPSRMFCQGGGGSRGPKLSGADSDTESGCPQALRVPSGARRTWRPVSSQEKAADIADLLVGS